MSSEREFLGPNFAYLLELYDRYRADPAAVDPATRQLFERWQPADVGPSTVELAAPSSVDWTGTRALLGAANLAQAVRLYGYLGARLDPLGTKPPGDPLLTLEFHRVSEADLRALPAWVAGLPEGQGGANAYEAVQSLRAIYSGTVGYDYGHVRLPEERQWLQQAAETGRFRPPQAPFDEIQLLERLTRVEAFELFLHRQYPGKTRFSIEGLDMLVPVLDEVITAAAQDEICAVLVGMAHRGRLNVLAHVLHMPVGQILAEFSDPQSRPVTWDEMGWTGDVKYHMGGYRTPDSGGPIDLVIRMPANPSHLELIDPVILGMARAANTGVSRPGVPEYYPEASLPILIHGDAAFSGQGIVAETLNLSRLPGYTVSGCLHIISNNQLGFTATEGESRSSLHASDLAKAFEMPILHVNADDPAACLEAARTAYAYRARFHKDFVINLVGYRRYGHNEGDEPRFTQPVMYQAVDSQPSARKLWAARLEESGRIEAGEADRLLQTALVELQETSDRLDVKQALEEPRPQPPPRGAAHKIKTAVPLERLRQLNQALLQFPADFQLNPRLAKSIEKRRRLLDDPESAKVDWAAAEELALATVLQDGTAVRLTGQDSIRGTFSQRHAVFYDAHSNQPYSPLQCLPQASAPIEILNSPLSEAGALGFEVGYNLQSPDRLALWEAQYGDFINNAQTVIDEFLLSGRAKWGLTPSLVLLLPHGNEGMGPDHSSARIERFLGLAAELNVRICYPSTAAQYFHLLRRQALLLKTDPLPLVVFTPKGLLRHPLTASPLEELTGGGWQPLFDDPDLPAGREAVRSLILCSGRVYVDLVSSDLRAANPDEAIVRVEQLYPFPNQSLEELLASYPNLERVIWVQEEPLNMGAWNFARPRLRQLMEDRLPLFYVGRPESSSPAEGSTSQFRLNQRALIEQAFDFDRQAQVTSVVKKSG